MCQNKRNITINIGPQDPMSWFCLSCALAAITFFAIALPALSKSDSEIAKANAEAHAKEEVAKAQSAAK